MEIEEFVVLLLEGVDKALELLEDSVDVLEVVLLEGTELLDSAEKLNELGHSAAEEVKLSEDLVGRELELFTLWHVHETLLGDLVLFLVGLVELEAGLENWDQLFRWIVIVVPQDIVVDDFLARVDSAFSDSLEIENVLLAVVDHLLGDLDEQASHAIVSVIVPGDGMDHLDAVHQGRECVLDRIRGSLIEGLDELLESRKILNIVLGLVESLSDTELDASPLGGGKVNLVTGLSELLISVLRGLSKHIVDSAAVLAAELL